MTSADTRRSLRRAKIVLLSARESSLVPGSFLWHTGRLSCSRLSHLLKLNLLVEGDGGLRLLSLWAIAAFMLPSERIPTRMIAFVRVPCSQTCFRLVGSCLKIPLLANFKIQLFVLIRINRHRCLFRFGLTIIIYGNLITDSDGI